MHKCSPSFDRVHGRLRCAPWDLPTALSTLPAPLPRMQFALVLEKGDAFQTLLPSLLMSVCSTHKFDKLRS